MSTSNPSAGHGAAQPLRETTPTQDMFAQLALEKRALRILASSQVQAAQKVVEALFVASKVAENPEARARIPLAASRFAMAAVENAILNDPARPEIMWVLTQPRSWHGVQWPGSAWGGHNPDNFSRDVMIDGASTYEISGKRTGSGPAHATFLVYSSFIGTTYKSMEGAEIIGSLQDKDIAFEADGSFTVTVGPEPRENARNYIQTGPNAQLLKIRNALEDWWTQVPDRLRIKRISGPPASAPRSDEEIAELAASLAKTQAAYWMPSDTPAGEPNKPRPATGRVGGWGFLTGGQFKLAADEALVITIEAMGAAYLGFQIVDAWSIPPNYIDFNAGLNKLQAKPGADGSYTYVLSASDPGVWNWVDTVGLREGGFVIRWQRLADPSVEIDSAVRESKVVKLSELRTALSAQTHWVDAAERKKQLMDRAASFARRLEN